jgi:peptide/nickel transport system substrate-binding protein
MTTMTRPRFNAAVTGVANPSPHRGGTLRLASSADVDSLDPARTYYVWSWLLQRALHRTVMAFRPAPGGAGREVVPDLAVAPGTSSDGGLTWTYRLRPGVRFEDGTPVRAADVKYAVERVFAQHLLPGGPIQLVQLLDAEGYRGPYGDPGSPVPAVAAPDEQTLVFRLRRPFADFDYLMALPNTAPVPRSRDTGEHYQHHPVATGPYRIAGYRPGRWLDVVRNPAWEPATDPVRSALPDRITVRIGLDVDERDRRLIDGEFDLDVEGRGVQPAAQRRILADPELRRRADNPLTGFLHYLSIQPAVPPFDNVHARRAVHYAADRVTLQFARGGRVTGGEIATSLIPPTLPAYQDLDRYPAGPDQRGDLDQARRELAAAGLPDGFDTVIATQRGKFHQVAVAVREAVARVGIRAEVVDLDVASYYRTGVGHPETVRRDGLGLVVTDWGADFPTEYGFLGPLVDGRQIKPGGGNFNIAELDDPVVNRLVDRALSTGDPGQRRELWRKVQRLVLEHAVILPVVFDRTLHYRGPRATNVYVQSAFGLYDLQAVGVAT